MTGIRIYQKILDGMTDNQMIAEACSCTLEEVETARKELKV